MLRINFLNVQLSPICHLLALLAHHIIHVSGVRVKFVEILDIACKPLWVRNAISTYTRLPTLFRFDNYNVSQYIFFKILYCYQSLRTTCVLFPSSGNHQSFAVPFRYAHNWSLRRLEVILNSNQSNITANLHSWILSHQTDVFLM